CKSGGADSLQQISFVVGIAERGAGPVKSFVEIRAERFAVPIKTAIAVAKAQAPKQAATCAAVGDRLECGFHFLRTDETEFTNDVGLAASCPRGVFADGLGEGFYFAIGIMMRGDDVH